MGTFTSFRKAYGALKDSTMVGLAKVNSEYKDLDVAIVKATNHAESPPKERHLRIIFSATSAMRPRADVAYCIHALSRRLAKTHSWTVAIKTLIVIHRTLREGDPTFREEFLSYSYRAQVLQVSNFKDDSSLRAGDCSAWVRAYALFLQERLECFRILKYDIAAERLTKTSRGATKGHSRTRLLNGEELLEQLPALQQLLFRLTGCQPDGAAYSNYLVQYALALVLKESFKIYCAINDGIINLVDLFFDMAKNDAVKALNIYKRAGRQAEILADFYEYCKGLELARHFQFPILKQSPPSFLSTMEEYIKEASQNGSVSNNRLGYRETRQELEQPAESAPQDCKNQIEEIEDKPIIDTKEEPEPKKEEAPPLISAEETGDLLGVNDVNPKGDELGESNALALAIVPPSNDPPSTNRELTEIGKTSGWELALVTMPSNKNIQLSDSKLAGGFDKLLLDSLYEDDTARRQIQLHNAGYSTGKRYEMTAENPFDRRDSFIMSNPMLPQNNMQMAAMAQQQQQHEQHHPMLQQQYLQHQQSMAMMASPHQYLPQYPQQQFPFMTMGPSNPFGDPFNYPQNATPQHGNHTLL
ncbi:putative clathrin assembly protein At5g57200 [Diospyros lotus]|uniref:putative clathrin assembly protein At5g57200 n=1 Tax=Diospyros lotus TaxID=55363 RepID=UPI00225A0713|nr:putative clathrin assembly protein At5g57200 [Diospyros lotus]